MTYHRSVPRFGSLADRRFVSQACFAALCFVAFVAILTGCGGSDGAMVEEYLEEGPYPMPLTLDRAEGGRDGGEVNATISFTGDGGGSFDLELTLVVDPRPSMRQGHWSYHGPTGSADGVVGVADVRFTGGQGDGVSVGGRFECLDGDQPRFRVTLPLTVLARDYR